MKSPAEESTENVVIETLISHRTTARSNVTVESLHDIFNSAGQEFIGVIDLDGTFRGLASRRVHVQLLSGRYGFSLHRDESILNHLVPNPVVLRVGMTLPEAAAEIFSLDQVPDLQTDAVVVDHQYRFAGIISSTDLVHYQWKLSREQALQISEQKNAIIQKNRAIFESQDELRLKKGQFNIIFENDIQGVALLDEFGKIEVCNQAFRKLSAISDEDSLPDFYDLLVDEQKSSVKQRFESLNPSQNSIRLETLLQLGPDNLREIHGVASLVRETGQIAIQIDDVTHRRALERQMASQEKSLLLDTLVGGIAHEINNKLTPIIGFSQLHMQLEKSPDVEEVSQAFRLIRDCATEASSIIAQLLHLSKPPTSRMAIYDARQLIEDTVNLLRFQARESGCQLSYTSPDYEIPVLADMAQLKQVMINLVINAIHASKETQSPVVKLSISAEKGQVTIDVTDQGCGIAREDLARIFDPFFTTKGPEKGNGLGLSVCRSIMALHSGNLEASSEPGSDTTLRMILPLASTQQEPNSECPLPTDTGGERISGHSANILIVDDEPYLGQLIKKGLKRELGLEPTTVLDGRKAIEHIKRDDYDLIISDVRMPNLDGFQLFEWICTHRPELSKRFLFITGDAGGKVFNERLSRINAPVLHKPFDLTALSNHCSEMLSGPVENSPIALVS